MCGINGFTFQDARLLQNMHEITRHRGPDDEGFFASPTCSLAHNRLAIIDVSSGGHQPMHSSDGRYAMVFNGEIYNYRELKSLLEAQGERFVSTSDSEVLLRVFVREGVDGIRRLHGIFAFAIWDRVEEELVLVRDQVGVKPLYYIIDGPRVLFSSESRALLSYQDAQMDPESMRLYFRLLYVPGPRTMFSSIQKLLPGTLLRWKKGVLRLETWWTWEEPSLMTEPREAKKMLRSTLEQAVQSQLVADRPVGLFLSGGIDSSLIAGLMSGAAHGRVKTFTVGYETDLERERYNADFALAQKTADYFHTDHQGVMLRAKDVERLLPEVVVHMDEPVANHIQTSTYFLSEIARKDVVVVLGGDGGDELFGGYPRYWLNAQLERFQSLPHFIQRAVVQGLSWIGRNAFSARLRIPFGVERYLAFMAQKEEMISRFLKDDTSPSYAYLQSLFSPAWKDETNQLMCADLRTWMPDESLIRSDRMSMAHALEQRVPLLDVDLIQLAMAIPSSWKLQSRSQGKKILIDVFRDMLPPHILHQEKRAWMSPMAKWIRGPLLPFVREVLSPSYCAHTKDYFDFQAIDRILSDHISKRQYALNTIWSLVTFQLWYRAFMYQEKI